MYRLSYLLMFWPRARSCSDKSRILEVAEL